MVQTVVYSKFLTGLNFVDLSQYVLNFVDIVYTMKTTKIYTPRNSLRNKYITAVQIKTKISLTHLQINQVLINLMSVIIMFSFDSQQYGGATGWHTTL